ncbi:MAG TPA: GTP cyclohydrolase I FolE2 [Myxococcales bacterium]|nr:GTP cyclohydrolase I FolE2 [Myxococcales bacterium]HAN31908.1 GTP cyclohydrolase I FolE2 [Myxococcales bacterium]
MPDIVNDAEPEYRGTLGRVGMSEVELPLTLSDSEGQLQGTVAHADAWVNLIDPDAKGIHMSRLYVGMDQHLAGQILTVEALRTTLELFVDKHGPLSSEACIALRFERMRRRTALVSSHQGWRSYPVQVKATYKADKLSIELAFSVHYSSTCPCSASLARQLIQERFDADFQGKESLHVDTVREWLGKAESICATPHSQRSEAKIVVRLRPNSDALPIDEMIDTIEDTLKTVVQAAVKREDEQAFALLNGRNLMFCEDAARRVQACLEEHDEIVDYRAECRHAESLHPHDAVAIAVKGIEGGLQA